MVLLATGSLACSPAPFSFGVEERGMYWSSSASVENSIITGSLSAVTDSIIVTVDSLGASFATSRPGLSSSTFLLGVRCESFSDF